MTANTANVVNHLVTLTNPAMSDAEKMTLAIAVSSLPASPDPALETIGEIIADNGITAHGAEKVADYLARLINVDHAKLKRRPRKPFPALFREAKKKF